MKKLDQLLSSANQKAKNNVSTNKKGKWREIEQLKEKFQLEKELKAYENFSDYLLEDF